MPWRKMPKKDVVVCEKPRGADKQALYPGMSEWGNPPALRESLYEFIVQRREPREVKPLSTWWKRKYNDSLSSGERKGKSSNLVYVRTNGLLIRVAMIKNGSS